MLEGWIEDLKQIAANPNYAILKYRHMLEGWIKDSKEIAADPSTPPHVLIKLSKHKNYQNKNYQIRFLVASNPNTPVETLKCLGKESYRGEEFADAIVENPVFDRLKLEDPYSKFVRLILARSTKTPPEVLAKLIATEKSDIDICWAVAKNINTPIDTLDNLAIEIANGTTGNVYSTKTITRSDNWQSWFYLFKDIINNPNISETCLEKVLDISIDRNHSDLVSVFLSTVNISNFSYRMLEKVSLYQLGAKLQIIDGYGHLLIDLPTVNKSPIILDNIARNTSNSKYDVDVFLKIANNSLTLTRTIEYIAAHDSSQVRNALIDHPNVSRKALDIILFMQGKLGTSVELLRELAKDFRVLGELCTYPDVPSEVLDIMSNNLPVMFPHGTYRWLILTHLAYHPNSSNSLLQKIIKELEEVGSFISKGYPPENYYNVSHANFKKARALKEADDLQKTNKLTTKIVRRLREHFPETNKTRLTTKIVRRLREHLPETNKTRVAFKKTDDLQEINKLTTKIVRRLKGEHLAETDKIRAYWATVTKQKTTEDRYSWENLYQSDPIIINWRWWEI